MKLGRTNFTADLVRINSLHFNKWIFEPGMLFRSGLKWWGNRGDRGEQHNGLDLLSYEATDGTCKIIDAGTKVPIIYEGRLVSCVRDFLGYSIFAKHEICEGGSRLFTIYGHVMKTPDISIGDKVKEGTVIATLSKTSEKKVPGHLHISVALVPDTIPHDILSWEVLNEAGNAEFIDPVIII